MPERKQIRIDGLVFAKDNDLDHAAFLQAFNNWLESNGWEFFGHSKQVNETDADETVEWLARKLLDEMKEGGQK